MENFCVKFDKLRNAGPRESCRIHLFVVPNRASYLYLSLSLQSIVCVLCVEVCLYRMRAAVLFKKKEHAYCITLKHRTLYFGFEIAGG